MILEILNQYLYTDYNGVISIVGYAALQGIKTSTFPECGHHALSVAYVYFFDDSSGIEVIYVLPKDIGIKPEAILQMFDHILPQTRIPLSIQEYTFILRSLSKV